MKKKILLLTVSALIIIILGGFFYIYNPFYQGNDYEPNVFQINDIEVNDFTYILQYDQYNSKEGVVEDLKSTPFDLIIMDAFYDTTAWTQEEIHYIQFNSKQPKILLSYISIGEAETYRDYWDQNWDADNDGIPDESAPDWLDIENPDWEGNYKVKFWKEEWANIIFGTNESYVDKIITQGFAGIYMDIIDAFEYFEELGDSLAPQKMVNFVKNISQYAKSINPEFLIVPQNGERLAELEGYLDYVDGIGREDVEYEDNWKNSKEECDYTNQYLQTFLSAGKFVLEVEYCTFPRFINDVYASATNQGYLCYAGPRNLANIQLNSNFLPD
ncbi:hypothetical protein NEF87_003759 [Candidatus Lokiarchaeum ossiferum]|uniref:Glycoside-hydrolase family GH114 TIM-barrel domain-containing protein n=1 Tax=Candidatus Lokiarchaeum ossiferum TaxID=2951803 RepID=A0ABY6HYF4_9ARCH|nr:hypothetical protein NEF87_003759 [Candidatus Lokiarchaeum sp. B-35]